MDRAGAYRLVQHIASGGMGVVYLGERDDGQVRHQAAVKILRRGLEAGEQVRRFATERQILASLDHPHIARLIDAGITSDHRPYFVMEYVKGEALDVYCDQHRLTIPQRVALIRDVALAVDFAHRQLIVHRDLKPSNILVNQSGQVKLLDFGIAKLIDDDPNATMMTGPGVRLMTPGYASPEQIVGERITTATDVYALGLLLFELLTGRRAQPTDGLTLTEIEQLVVHGPIPSPSEAVARPLPANADGKTDEAIAAARGTTVPKLRKQLDADLDRIVGEALLKEPERRYRSAQALADDLDRYLNGEAIVARGDSTAYRIRKFVRRRWPVLAAAAVFLLMLVGYAVTVTLYARELTRERDRARAAQDQSEEVASFLVRMFQASDPSEARGDAITARELLATGVARIDALQSQPEVQGQLLDVIGRVYQGLGKYDEAETLIKRGLEVRQQPTGGTPADVALSLTHLGELSSLRGRHDEAETRLREALALHEAQAGAISALAATDRHLLGAALVDKGQRQEGKALFEEALAIRRRVLPPTDPDIAESLAGLAYVASMLGDFEEMERRHREALDILRAAFVAPHPRIALGLNNLAAAVDNRGRSEEAIALHQEALAMRRTLFGEEHPAVANSLNNLSRAYQRIGRFDEAAPLLRQAVALREQLLGPDHPSTATSLQNLSVVLMRQGKGAEAEPLIRRARRITVARLSERHPSVLTIDSNLAVLLADLGRDREAERLFVDTLRARIEVLGPDHPDIAWSRIGYGRFLSARRRYADAEPLLEAAYRARERRLGREHPETRAAATALADVYRATGRAERASSLLTDVPASRRP